MPSKRGVFAFLLSVCSCLLLSLEAQEDHRLLLDGQAADPRDGLPVLVPELGPTLAVAGRPSLHLVQFPGPARAAWLEALRGRGVKVLQYLPRDAFFVWGKKEDILAAAGAAPIRFSGPLPLDWKIAPGLRETLRRTLRKPGEAAGRAPIGVVIQLFDAGDARSLPKWLARAGVGPIQETHVANRLHLRASVPARLLAGIARWPEVFRVEPLPRHHLLGEREAVVSAGAYPPGATCVAPGYQAWLARKGVTGDGIVVQVIDDGIEQGDVSGLPGTAHPDLLGRILGVDNATSDPKADSLAGHGSLNAGIIAATAATGVKDAAGFLGGQGIAPGARIFATKIFNDLGRFDIGPRTFLGLTEPAARAGATISSNSWGASTFGEYDAEAVEFDALVRDADSAPGDQPMTIVFAAGNDGDIFADSQMTIGSPATGKNIISLGASESCDADGLDGCQVPAESADSIRDLDSASSRGPMADGRMGPTLVAPGTHVAGVASTAVGYDGSGVCDQYWPAGQTLYARSSGTSHACPQAAGAAALFQEYRRSATGQIPSPALVKAALAAAARDQAGGGDGFGGAIPPAPNNLVGWGILSMEDLIPDRGALSRALYFDQPVSLQDAGDVWETLAFPTSGADPVKVALSWTDPPGTPGAGAILVNDLDLEVESGGETYRGNVFQQGFSIPGGEADHLDNLEAVFLEKPGPLLVIRVRAARIAGDGVPGGNPLDQDFSVVVQGATDRSSRGVVVLRRTVLACSSLLEMTVSDLDLKGTGTATVDVQSSDAPAAIRLTLNEAAPDTGVFTGSAALGTGAGQVPASDGATLTVRYQDADDGTGKPAEWTASARVDCSAPSITGVHLEDLDASSVKVVWTTSEEATGTVHWGKKCPAADGEARSGRTTAHSVLLSGLEPRTRYFYTVTAEDPVGNAASDDRGGRCYTFVTSTPVSVYLDTLEPQPLAGWTHHASVGLDNWAPTVFAAAHSRTHAWHSPGADASKDDSLISPPMDIGAGDLLSFWHVYQFEEGYDGAVVEISTDGGTTWGDLGPAIKMGGYVGPVSNEFLKDGPGWTGRSPAAMSEVQVDLGAFAGAGRRIRFRLTCDSGAFDGYGWYIDDIGVLRPVNKRAGLRLDRSVYRCEDQVLVQVDDLDLAGAAGATVSVHSTSHPQPMDVALTESAAGTGRFAGAFRLGTGAGELAAAHGDEITAEFLDQDDGQDQGPVAAAATRSVDCRAPAISRFRIQEVLDDQVTFAWETDEPTEGEVSVGATCAAPQIVQSTALGGTTHQLAIGGLKTGELLRAHLLVRDEAGNSTIEDAGGQCLPFTPLVARTALYDFDAGAPGWGQASLDGQVRWSLVNSPLAVSPPGAWFLPGSDGPSDTVLLSPPMFIPLGSLLSFWHAYDFEETYDGGVIEISIDGGAAWVDLGPSILRGGYNSVIDSHNPLNGRPAWSGTSMDAMTRVLVSLDGFAGKYCQVRFRAATDGSFGGVGWTIDHFEILQGIEAKGVLSLDRGAYGCRDRITLRLLDSGLIGSQEVRVAVTSTSQPAPFEVVLGEKSPSSGFFEGGLDIAADGGPGAVKAVDGDRVTARFVDPDDGTGAAREVTAEAIIDCRAPSISKVVVSGVDETSAVISFETDEDTTGRIELGASCAGAATAIDSSAVGKSHQVLAGGLSPGTQYFFRVDVRDLAGNATVDDLGGSCRTFRTLVDLLLFEDKLEPKAQPGWAVSGRWRFTTDALASSPSHVWKIAGNNLPDDSTLLLPPAPVDAGTILEFHHTFASEEGFTGGVIEMSVDGGGSWAVIEDGFLEGGYNGTLLPGTPLEGHQAFSGGTSGPMTRVRVRLQPPDGAVVLLRFRWVSVGFFDDGSLWLIDDLRLLRMVGHGGEVRFEKTRYACGAKGVILLADSDLTGRGTAGVSLIGSRNPDFSFTIMAQETAPGFFRGQFTLTSEDSPGSPPTALPAQHDDILTASYLDAANDGGGSGAVTSFAQVDCRVPQISNVRLGAAGPSSLEVLWDTDEPAWGWILRGSTCAGLGSPVPTLALRSTQRATLNGLSPGKTVFFRVQAQDTSGYLSVSPLAPSCLQATIHAECSFSDTLEPAAAGWSHAAAVGADDWRLVAFNSSHSPTRSFHSPNQGVQKDCWLVTPPLQVLADSVFSFWHTFELQEQLAGGILEISIDGGASWNDLGANILVGGYNEEFITPRDFRPGWTGGTIGAMTAVQVSLGDFAGPDRLIRFHLFCEEAPGSAGWYVDDVSLCSFRGQAASPSFARGNCAADGAIDTTDVIVLLEYLFTAGAVPRCLRACDANGDGDLGILDAVHLLAYLFRSGVTLPEPTVCGALLDPGTIDCGAAACLGQ